jgi:quinolinate synthase
MAETAQKSLPVDYQHVSEPDLFDRILRAKATLGDRLVILGHHYQADEVIQFADFVGDSLKLSQQAADQDRAEFVVFCGVHFMAESADIVTQPEVRVILPHLDAGCTMADMATLEQVETAWKFLTASVGEARFIPITYVNSSAVIKAFVGRNGGACCTSSNAPVVIDWALSHGEKVLFLPDQHLGRNTLYQMGYPLDGMLMWDPDEPNGGLTADQVATCRAVLWDGFCSVHMVFSETHCKRIRESDPACRILVHPECRWSVFEEADLAGSTEFIIQTIEDAPDGSHWAIGTETHLVDRLAKQHGDRLSIRNLAKFRSDCRTMGMVDPRHLGWVLDNLAAGTVVNQISVEPAVRGDALLALERMLDLKPSQPVKG